MQIGKARVTDIVKLQNIARRVIPNNYAPFLGCENVQRFIDSGQSDKEIEIGMEHCHIIQEGETIAGFAIVYGDLLHLIMIDVPYQRHGYGAELLAFVEKIMFNDHQIIKLQIFEKNHDTMRFYQKNGWATIKSEYVDDVEMNMLHMEKQKEVTRQPKIQSFLLCLACCYFVFPSTRTTIRNAEVHRPECDRRYSPKATVRLAQEDVVMYFTNEDGRYD